MNQQEKAAIEYKALFIISCTHKNDISHYIVLYTTLVLQLHFVFEMLQGSKTYMNSSTSFKHYKNILIYECIHKILIQNNNKLHNMNEINNNHHIDTTSEKS